MLNDQQNPWTDNRIAELRQLWNDGLTCSQIALQMNCGFSRNAIIGKASRLGLQARTVQMRKARYRSGPISYAEKLRRADERATLTSIRNTEKRERNLAGRLAPMVVIEAPKQAEFLALTFGELRRNQCHYPRGDGAEIRFCGQPRMKPTYYCEYCHSICHQTARHRLPPSTRETQQTLVLTAGTPPLSGVTGGESAA